MLLDVRVEITGCIQSDCFSHGLTVCDPDHSGSRMSFTLVLCSEGYTSSLAAASLLDLGLHRATDVVGGYRALRTQGGLAEFT